MKQLYIAFLGALLFVSHLVEGQTTYQKLILPAVPYSSQGLANNICSNGSNGYMVVGNMRPSAAMATDVAIQNMDQNGNLLWSRIIGNQILETGQSIQLLPDNNFIILGNTGASGSPFQDILLMKIDNLGNILWSESIGSTGADFGYSIANTNDNGLILTGNTINNGDRNIFLIKTDSTGNIQWAKTFGDTLFQAAYAVKECVNGDFILTGSVGYYIAPYYYYDNVLIRTDNQGLIKWSKKYGEQFHGESGYDVSETYDGGFIVTGSTTSAYGNATLLKTDSLGNVNWFRTYGGYFYPNVGGDDDGKQTIQLIDGSYLLTGTYVNFPYTFDPSTLLMKLDSTGNIIWANYYKSSSGNRGNCLYSINSNEFVIGGYSNGNNWNSIILMQVDSNGNSGCYDSIANISSQLLLNYTVTSIIIPDDTVFFAIGAYTVTQNNYCIDSTICLLTGLELINDNLVKFSAYPNPFSGSTIIESDYILKNATIDLLNTKGISVRKMNDINGERIFLEQDNLPQGMYILLIHENGLLLGKIKILILN